MERYILIYGDGKTGPAGVLRLIGPFESEEALAKWGRHWQADNGDDPRWQEMAFEMPLTSRYIVDVEAP
jgi:hypothetical protein